MENVKDKTVFVGLSGGVDSAVAAALLKQAGARVVGVFMKNWAGEAGLQLDCPWQEDLESAQVVAKHLQIEFRSYNFEQEYKQYVLDYFFAEYEAGRTPNPDILCNSEIKFKAFLNKAIIEGADLIATGHYAGKEQLELNLAGIQTKITALVRASDSNKDQTYFLSGLTQSQLNKSVFPLTKHTKPEVRALALKFGLPNARRKDSQGICFIGDLDVQAFLHKYLKPSPGEIIDIDTKAVVGKHQGVAFYTIGQREGLGIGGLKQPYYVVGKDLATKRLFVGLGHNHHALLAQEATFTNLEWIYPQLAALPGAEINKLGLTAAIRYRHQDQPGQLMGKDSFRFNSPQRALTPGQSLVFYTGNICLGRAVIS